MARNDVTRVSAPDTTEGTKRRNAEIAAEAAAREKAEIEYYRSMVDPNNQSAEALAFRDGPIQSLTPDVIEMIALGKPTEWVLKAAGKYVVKPAMKKSGGVVKKMIDNSLDFGGRTVDSVGNMSTIVNWTKRHASGKAKADLKAIFGKQAEEDLAKNGLHLQRQLPVTSLKKDLADGHATAPSIEIVGSRSASGVQSGGYGGGNTSGNFSDAPVVIHYKRSAFNVDPENLDIAKATDIWSPSSFRVKELREQGMSWADIVKSWKQHPDGSKYALDIDVTPEGKVITVPVTPDSRIKFGVGGGVERRLGDLPTKIIQDQYRPGYRTGDSPDHLGIPLRAAKDNRFGSEFDVVRDPRSAVSGELKPFREVPNDQAIDFVEIPRSWTVKGKRMYSTKERYELQRELEKAGIKYRVYDEGSFTSEDLSLHYPGAPKASVKWLGIKDKISDKWDYGKMKPELFREDAKGGQSADVRAATKVGSGKGVRLSSYKYTATNDLDKVVIDPKNIKGTGISFDPSKDRVKVKPEDQMEFESWLDYIAGLDPTMEKQRLVPPDWRTNKHWNSPDGYQKDYDFAAAFYEGKKYSDPLESMVTLEPDGLYHLDDRGKAPNHPTFSKYSHYYLDETLRKKYGELAGDWEKSSDGEWTYVPGPAESKVPDGTVRTLREINAVRQATKGGDNGEKSQDYTAHSESTAPTDEQLQEAVEFLETVMEIGAPQNEWEQSVVQRTHDILVKTLETSAANKGPDGDRPETPEDTGTGMQADLGGGIAGSPDKEERPELVGDGTSDAKQMMIADNGERGLNTESPDQATQEQNTAEANEFVEAFAADQAKDVAAAEAANSPRQAERGEDGHFHDASGRIVSQRTAQKELGDQFKKEQDVAKQNAATEQTAMKALDEGWQAGFGKSEENNKLIADIQKNTGFDFGGGGQQVAQQNGQDGQQVAQQNGQDGRQETGYGMVAGLEVSGVRGNIFEMNGRRISSREADRLLEAEKKNRGLG